MVDDKHLSVARHLEVDGLKHYVVVYGVDRGEYGITVGGEWLWPTGRGLPSARTAGCAEWGGRHGECVDIDLHLLQLLLYGDTEFLLLVDDKQSEVLEFDVFPDKLVSAYENVDFAFGKVGLYLFHLLCASSSRQVVDTHGKLFQSILECVEVLIGEHCCWNENGCLLVVGRGLEGGAYCNFRFAESHIAAYKAVHRSRRLHVVFNRLCGRQLVGGILIYK